jgi:hypothetical protein
MEIEIFFLFQANSEFLRMRKYNEYISENYFLVKYPLLRYALMEKHLKRSLELFGTGNSIFYGKKKVLIHDLGYRLHLRFYNNLDKFILYHIPYF